MTLLDFLFGPPSLDGDPLAKPDKNEAKNLGLHVRQCAARYSALRRDLMTLQRWFMILILALLTTNVLDLKSLVKALIGF